MLVDQLELINSEFLHTREVLRLEEIVTNHTAEEIEGYRAFGNMDEFGRVIK